MQFGANADVHVTQKDDILITCNVNLFLLQYRRCNISHHSISNNMS